MTFRSHSRFTRCVAVAVAIAVAPLILISTGCYKDDSPSENLVTGKDGELSRPDTKTIDASAPPAAPEKRSRISDASIPTESDFGIPFYPGARQHTGIDGMTKSQKQSDGSAVAVLDSHDDKDRVLAYYKAQMPHATELTETVDNAPATSLSEPWNENGLHSVAILKRGDVTEIQLTSFPGDKKIKQSTEKEAKQMTGLDQIKPNGAAKPEVAAPTNYGFQYAPNGVQPSVLSPAKPASGSPKDTSPTFPSSKPDPYNPEPTATP